MTEEKIPKYMLGFKKDIIDHVDSSMNRLKNELIIYTDNSIHGLKNDLITYTDNSIKGLKNELINNTNDSVNELAIMINNNFATKQDLERFATNTKEDFRILDSRIDNIENNMATKKDIKEICSLIGSYEVRARKIEEILTEDHGPRIVDLEKTVYST